MGNLVRRLGKDRQMANRSSHERMGAGGNELPPQIEDRIATERRRLQQAAAVLTALAIAVDEDPEAFDAGDVALVAKELIEMAATNLDSVSLQRK